MVELNTMEKEIKKLLKKQEESDNIYHLTPTEIKMIKYKHSLLTFLKNPKGKHVVWKFAGNAEYDVHHSKSLISFYDDIEDHINLRFTGNWFTHV